MCSLTSALSIGFGVEALESGLARGSFQSTLFGKIAGEKGRRTGIVEADDACVRYRPSTMIIHELSGDECRAILGGKNLARLACARDNQPYIVPLFCYYDREADCLYSVAAHGQKIDWMRANPKVCVEFSEISDQFHWRTVVVFGRYEELTASPADDHLRRRAHELFEQRPDWWFPAMQKPDPDRPARTVVYRIRIDELTGRWAARA